MVFFWAFLWIYVYIYDFFHQTRCSEVYEWSWSIECSILTWALGIYEIHLKKYGLLAYSENGEDDGRDVYHPAHDAPKTYFRWPGDHEHVQFTVFKRNFLFVRGSRAWTEYSIVRLENGLPDSPKKYTYLWNTKQDFPLFELFKKHLLKVLERLHYFIFQFSFVSGCTNRALAAKRQILGPQEYRNSTNL